MKRLTVPYKLLTNKQKELARELFVELTRYNSGRVIQDTVMVFTPNPYLVWREHWSGIDIDQHLADFRKILEMLKIPNKEAKAKDISMNLATRDVIYDYMSDHKRNERLGIKLTKEEKEFIWNFRW